MRRIVTSALAIAAGLALFLSPASAATLSLSVSRPATTAAGSYVTIKAKATPGAYCALGITGVLGYGHQKYASTSGAVSWRPRVPLSATGGDHSAKVSCVKGGKRVTRYTTLVVTHTYYWEGFGDADFSTEDLRIPEPTFTVTVEVQGGVYRSLSAEWTNSSGSRWDFFFTQDGPTREVSNEGNAWGWFNVQASDATYWRLTVTGVAN
jgi:hypothetical protein